MAGEQRAPEPQYKLPTPVLEEQHYSYAIVIELQRIRTSIEALTAAISAPQPPGEVVLKEPEPKPKPKRGDP